MTVNLPATVTPTAVTGDVCDAIASHYTYGSDLDYVLEQLDMADPIDRDAWDAPDTDYAVHKGAQPRSGRHYPP